MRMWGAGVAALVIAAATSPVSAATASWMEASSAHFVIDAYTTEPRLREFAERLERFDAALRFLYGRAENKDAANRVHIYAVSLDTIKRLSNDPDVAGFYRRGPGRSLIFSSALVAPKAAETQSGSRLETRPNFDMNAQTVLLHEYSHHFMYTNYQSAMPLWFSEGFAEFNSNARFDKDGSVVVGLAPAYRANALYSTRMTVDRLFEPPKQLYRDSALTDGFYGYGWLLTHYVLVEGHRQDQLNRYLKLLGEGKRGPEAAHEAFGDLAVLNNGMKALLRADRLSGIVAPPAGEPKIEIMPLNRGAAAVLPAYFASANGVTPATAPRVADEIEKRAAPFPDDARAQSMLAEADYDAGRLDLADAAAGRALAADPNDVHAMLYRGRIAIRRLKTASSRDPAAWRAARGWYVRANHAAPNAAEPLLLYYTSFADAGEPAPDIAYRGLIRARELAPEYGGIRVLIAGHMLAEKDLAGARAMLQPVAYDPHGDDPRVRKAIDAIDTGNAGDAIGTLADAGRDVD